MNALGPRVTLLSPLAAKPESLGQIVYAAIRDAIVEQVIPPGSPVSEVELARQLGVSKTPVREALLRLHAIGLVESAGMRGLRVVVSSDELLRNAYEVRAALEAGVARLAAAHATPAQRQEIVAAAEESLEHARRGDIARFQATDREFHRATADACANARLIELVENSATLARILRERDAPTQGDALRCAQFHLEIAGAIERGDAPGAGAVASEHVEFVYGMVVAARAAATAPAEDPTSAGALPS